MTEGCQRGGGAPGGASAAGALTFIIGELKVVVHGGYKLLHKEAPDARRQALLTSDLTAQDICVEI